ncbi:hypothetical protein Bca4012_036338 [Brassica carinata]
MANDEFQEARKEMIKFWNENEDLVSGGEIRVKRMGHLDTKPFVLAVKKKLRGGSRAKAGIKAMELCSFWEGQVGDVHWYPFKVDESDGFAKNVVDKNDEEVVKLKDTYGEELYDDVVRAKMEIVEYNPSGGYKVSELCNFEKVVAMKNKRKWPVPNTRNNDAMLSSTFEIKVGVIKCPRINNMIKTFLTLLIKCLKQYLREFIHFLFIMLF